MHYGNAFEGAHPCRQLAGTSLKRFTKPFASLSTVGVRGRGVVGSRSRLIAPGAGTEERVERDPLLAGKQAPPEDKSRIGVINDRGVINCGLH